MAAIWGADLHVQPSNAWSVPLGVIQEKGGDSVLDTRVYCCLILKTQDFLDVCTLAALSTRSISSLLHLGHFSLCLSCSWKDSTMSKS